MADASKADPEPWEPRRLGRFTWTAIVAVIAMASSLTALTYELFPGIKPDPRTSLGANVSVFAVEPGLSQDQYLQRLASSDNDLGKLERDACKGAARCGALDLPGEQVYVQTDVEGFKRKDVLMRASLYNARTRVREQNLTQIVARESLQSPSDRAVVPIWMPCPDDNSNAYFVRIELFHQGDHVLLAVNDSKPFPGRCRTTG
jgi:hypothetical protein